MSMRWLAVVMVIGVLGLGFAAWWTQRAKPAPTEQSAPAAPAPAQDQGALGGATDQGGPPASAGPGLTWTVPAKWMPQGERAMRLATYTIPGKGGEKNAGECAVFYFGAGQGGDVNANIDRWIGQFDQPQVGAHTSRDVNGMTVVEVEVRGVYLAPSGPRMESQGKLDHYMLLGAIAQGPQGNVFFKLTGPEATVDAARKEWGAMIGSLKKA